MGKIIITIAPIFAVIIFGSVLRLRGFFPKEFTRAANDLVYHVAIPVMIFEKVAKSDFGESISFSAAFGLVISVVLAFALICLFSRMTGFADNTKATLIQSSIHGNLGYVAFAVAFYFLDSNGFARTVIIGSFLILTQNFLSVSILEYFIGKSKSSLRINWMEVLKAISINPIIIATVLGILVSLSRLSIPVFLERTLKIISSMALPMALFLIGASIRVKDLKKHFREILTANIFKLVVLPATGYLFFALLKVPLEYQLPGLILLAAPSATVTYIMAVELKGDPELAATNVSVSTLASGVGYILWLTIGSRGFTG